MVCHVRKQDNRELIVCGKSLALLWCVGVLLAAQRPAPELALDQAAKDIEQGKTAEAEQKLQLVLAKEPSNLLALILEGAVLDSEKRYKDADAYYQRALKIAPRSVQVLNNLANHYLASGQRNQARESYRKAIAIDPRHQNANLQLARMSVEDRRGRQALAYLSRVERSSDNDPILLELRARALSLAGECGQASESASRLESQAAGAVYAECKMYDRAESSFARALDADPQNFDILYNLGLAAFHAEHIERAAGVFEIALHERPEDADCLYVLAQVHLRAQRLVESAALLARAAKVAPGHADILLLLARVSAELEFYHDAAGTYDRYLKLKPGDEAARRERASALAHEGPKARAGLIEYLSLPAAEQRARYLANLRKSVAADPSDFRRKIRLGRELLADGQNSEALAVFRELQPVVSDPEMLGQCGTILAQFEHYDAARPFLDGAIARAPSRSSIRLDLATALFHTQGAEPALKALDQTPEADRKGDYYLLRAQLLDSLGKVPEAADALNRGMQAAPTRAALYFQASSFLLKHRMRQEAVALLEQATRILPDARELLLAQWVALTLAQQDIDARKLLAKIQARWPEWDRPYLLNGILLEMQLKPAEARRALETAIVLGANTPEVYYYQALAITQAAPEDVDAAERAIERALALTAKDPYIYMVAGKISLARNDYSAAIRRLMEATRLQPMLIPAHYALRTAYNALGEKQKADAELDEIKRIGEKNAASEQSPFSVEDALFTVRPPA